MELSFFAPVLCLLLVASTALASLPNIDPEEHTGEVHLGRSRPITMIYHPSTSSCVLRGLVPDPLKLGPCTNSDSWSYTPQKNLMIKGTYFCLQANGLGKPVRLGIVCTLEETQWEVTGDSKRSHLSSKLADGTVICLDIEEDGTIVSNPCRRQSSGEEHDMQRFAMVTGHWGLDDAEKDAPCAAFESN